MGLPYGWEFGGNECAVKSAKLPRKTRRRESRLRTAPFGYPGLLAFVISVEGVD
jgi:hypothetical protein